MDCLVSDTTRLESDTAILGRESPTKVKETKAVKLDLTSLTFIDK